MYLCVFYHCQCLDSVSFCRYSTIHSSIPGLSTKFIKNTWGDELGLCGARRHGRRWWRLTGTAWNHWNSGNVWSQSWQMHFFCLFVLAFPTLCGRTRFEIVNLVIVCLILWCPCLNVVFGSFPSSLPSLFTEQLAHNCDRSLTQNLYELVTNNCRREASHLSMKLSSMQLCMISRQVLFRYLFAAISAPCIYNGIVYLPLFTYIWMIFMVNVGKYTIQGWYGLYISWSFWTISTILPQWGTAHKLKSDKKEHRAILPRTGRWLQEPSRFLLKDGYTKHGMVGFRMITASDVYRCPFSKGWNDDTWASNNSDPRMGSSFSMVLVVFCIEETSRIDQHRSMLSNDQ